MVQEPLHPRHRQDCRKVILLVAFELVFISGLELWVANGGPGEVLRGERDALVASHESCNGCL